MYNPKSGKIIETRDIQWLKKMFFQNDTIRSEFLEIWLYCDHKIDENDQQNLIQDDEITKNPEDIDGVQTNNNSEFKARKGENLEEEESSDEESVISTNTETSNSDPFPTQTTRSGRVIQTPQRFNFKANLTANTYNNITKFLNNTTLKRKTLKLQLYKQQLEVILTTPANKFQSNSRKQWLDPIKKNGWNWSNANVNVW